MDLFPRIRNRIIEDLYRFDSPAAVPRAREWVKEAVDLYKGPYAQRERRGHKFDVDNLACVVFQASFGPRHSRGRRALKWWRATLSRYPYPSLLATLSSEERPTFEVPGTKPLLDE